MRYIASAFLFLLLATILPAQVVGAPYPVFHVNPPSMVQFGSASTNGTGFLNTLAVAHNSIAAYIVFGTVLAVPPVQAPLTPQTANSEPLYLEPAAWILGPQPMNVAHSNPGIEWGYLQLLPNDPSLVGLTVYSQCAIVLAGGTWAITHAWATTLTP